MRNFISLLSVVFIFVSCNREDKQIFEDLNFPDEIRFNKLTSEVILPITNLSSKSLFFTFTISEPLKYRMGEEFVYPVEAGETVELDLELDRQLITNENTSAKIEIYIHAIDKSVTIPVIIESVIPNTIQLGFDIIDAEYYEKEEKIVAISTYPENALLIIDPDNGTTQKIALDSKPLSFHLNSKIDKVAIGQQNQFTIIDLITKEIDIRPFDIREGQVFLFNDSMLLANKASLSIKTSINLKTEETIEVGFHGNLKMKFHPHIENCVLATTIHQHPAKVSALDYSTFNLIELHSSIRKDDERDIHDNFWLTKNNDRIIAKGRGLFKCTPNNDDLEFVKVINDGSYINACTHIDKFGKVVTINRYVLQPWHVDQNQIVIFDDTNFEMVGKFPILNFPVTLHDENHYSTEGYFLFSNKQQSKLYALVTLGPSLVEGNKWKLLVYDTNKIFN